MDKFLKGIAEQFLPDSAIKEIKAFGNGHINDTFLVSLSDNEEEYILQKINTNVFKDADLLASNHLEVLRQVEKSEKTAFEIAAIFPTKEGDYIYKSITDEAWRLTSCIKNAYSIDLVEYLWQPFEAGKAYGWFINAMEGIDVSKFGEAIPNFHKLSFRIWQLNEAIDKNAAKRKESVTGLLRFYIDREKQLSVIDELVASGEIPLRVTHNDTKINNVLFSNEKAVAVIDLDTVGPGIILYDFGDALRTLANTANEDEKDLSKVNLNIKSYRKFAEGYLPQVKNVLSEKEKEYLQQAPILMTYIMGIRFLADYLNGDVYYKTKYPEHNLVRSKVQMELIKKFENNNEDLKKIIEALL